MWFNCKFKFLIFIGLLFYAASAQDQLGILIGDIKTGPSVYYSSDAYSYFTRNQQSIPSQPDKEIAFKSYRAAMSLIGLGSNAIAAVPVLLDVFPIAYHVSEVRNVQYTGEGSFEDWVHTYITGERNKFLLASPFLDYNSMSMCEQHIESSHEIERLDQVSGGSGKINLTIIFKLNIGACALEKITGMSFGKELSEWRKWWEEQGSSQLAGTASVTPVISGPSLSSGQAFSEIVKKAKYRILLSTGDELIGIVESKDDTSIILETTDGKPYSFGQMLIRRYELLAPPPLKKVSVTDEKNQEVKEKEIVIYDELKKMGKLSKIVEVTISNGSVFKGKLLTVDESMLSLDIEGSQIPIAKGVITQIALITQIQKPAESQKLKKPRGPLDTIYVKNPQTDEYGKPKEDLLFTGSIITVTNKSVSLELFEGGKKEIARVDITRIIRHSSNNYEESIKQYAKPLFCPDDMFLVDIPPGKQGRPFFKTCVDRYEYPNRRDVIPQGNVSYEDASNFCNKQGKRLCTQDEWQWACSGLEGYTYPYGWNRDDNKCNTDGSKSAERSGIRLNCVSKYGGFDMVGNIFEWVEGTEKEPMLMGGPYSKCQTVSPGVGGGAKPQTGFRCCKSN